MLYLLLILQQNLFNQLYTTKNTKHFSFKSGRAVHVVKLTKIVWLVVLQLEFRRNTTLYYLLKVLSLKYLSIEQVKLKK